MREPGEVVPRPRTSEEILRHGISEIAHMATGSHMVDPPYSETRRIKEYAQRILEAADVPPPRDPTRPSH